MDNYIRWEVGRLTNGIEIYVEYKWNKEIKKFEITERSQMIIDKALEMTYQNRETIEKELNELTKILGIL